MAVTRAPFFVARALPAEPKAFSVVIALPPRDARRNHPGVSDLSGYPFQSSEKKRIARKVADAA
jgi:hypothetical protein